MAPTLMPVIIETCQCITVAKRAGADAIRANLERLGSGDRAKIAEVVRGLSGLDRDHGLSAGEQRMLLRARQLLKEPPGDGEETDVREPRRPPAPSGVGAASMAMPVEPESTPTPGDACDDRQVP